jgi:glucose/arabinose dehydrogenase
MRIWNFAIRIAATLVFMGAVGVAQSAPNPATAPPPAPPFTDFRYEKPGVTHKILPADMPKPMATKSATNGPRLIDRPKNAWPVAPPGFKVELFATGFNEPRKILTAPNGDVFMVESSGGDLKLFRGISRDGKPVTTETFVAGLNRPYGIAFYPPGPDPKYVYVGNTDSIVRFPYHNGDLKASGPSEKIADLPAGGGHWTRDVVFSADGKQLFVAIGSASNANDPDTNPEEKGRANITVMSPDGSNRRIYASGIRNAGAGLAIDPKTGELWASVNERDQLGDNLVPDYISHIQDGAFYGWPYYYIGSNPDPRLKGKHPELKDKVTVPDVLIQPHNATLQLAFYEGKQFPAEYQGDIFSSQHGSWNKFVRTGYEVIRVPLHQSGKASGEYEDFVTGFVLPNGDVWGRPVGVTVAADGSLLVTDDGSNSVWRVSYVGGAK